MSKLKVGLCLLLSAIISMGLCFSLKIVKANSPNDAGAIQDKITECQAILEDVQADLEYMQTDDESYFLPVPLVFKTFNSRYELRDWIVARIPDIKNLPHDTAKMRTLQLMALNEGYIWSITNYGQKEQYDKSISLFVVNFPASVVVANGVAYLVRLNEDNYPIIRTIGRLRQ